MAGLIGVAAVRVGHDVPAVVPASPPTPVTDDWTPPGTEVVIGVSSLAGHPTIEAVMNDDPNETVVTDGMITDVVAPDSLRVISAAAKNDLVVLHNCFARIDRPDWSYALHRRPERRPWMRRIAW